VLPCPKAGLWAGAAMKKSALTGGPQGLARLPVTVTLRAVSIAEGIRAALTCGVTILLDQWLQRSPLAMAALAANLTCFCDVGGPIRNRSAALLSFTFIGAAIWGVFGLLRGFGLPVVLLLADANRPRISRPLVITRIKGRCADLHMPARLSAARLRWDLPP
jgi:hypothetical protein